VAAAAVRRRGARLLRADRSPGPDRTPPVWRRARSGNGSGWRLTGSKLFITLGTWSAFALVFARTGGARSARDHVLRRADGLARLPGDAAQGEARPAGPGHGELHLDGVEVPDSARLGDEGSGFRVAMSALDNGRISLAAGCVGLAQGALDACVAYTKERRQFGRPVASFQLVQEQLAGMAVETEAARLLTWRAAALSDAGAPAHARIVVRQAVRVRGRRPRRERGRPGPRRLRLRRRVSGRQVPPGRPGDDPLRGHERGAEAHHRPLPHRRKRLRLKLGELWVEEAGDGPRCS
jgi:hypothetical protein